MAFSFGVMPPCVRAACVHASEEKKRDHSAFRFAPGLVLTDVRRSSPSELVAAAPPAARRSAEAYAAWLALCAGEVAGGAFADSSLSVGELVVDYLDALEDAEGVEVVDAFSDAKTPERSTFGARGRLAFGAREGYTFGAREGSTFGAREGLAFGAREGLTFGARTTLGCALAHFYNLADVRECVAGGFYKLRGARFLGVVDDPDSALLDAVPDKTSFAAEEAAMAILNRPLGLFLRQPVVARVELSGVESLPLAPLLLAALTDTSLYERRALTEGTCAHLEQCPRCLDAPHRALGLAALPLRLPLRSDAKSRCFAAVAAAAELRCFDAVAAAPPGDAVAVEPLLARPEDDDVRWVRSDKYVAKLRVARAMGRAHCPVTERALPATAAAFDALLAALLVARSGAIVDPSTGQTHESAWLRFDVSTHAGWCALHDAHPSPQPRSAARPFLFPLEGGAFS